MIQLISNLKHLINLVIKLNQFMYKKLVLHLLQWI